MSSDDRPYQVRKEGVLLHVRLTPKGGQDRVEGITRLSDGQSVLKVRVRAVPEDGAANAGLIAVLAKFLHIPKSKIRLESGATARHKSLLVEMDVSALQAKLEPLTVEGSS
jgi:uncharacterized protein (TIGR00251 family)